MQRRLTLFLVDNNGRPTQFGMFLPDATGEAAALAFANMLRAPVLALSSAKLLGAELRIKLSGEVPRVIAAGADSRRSLTLFYSTGSETARLIIPSPVPGLAETAGPFAGYRVTRDSAAAAGLLAELDAIVAGTVTETGEPWPGPFSVGTIDEAT